MAASGKQSRKRASVPAKAATRGKSRNVVGSAKKAAPKPARDAEQGVTRALVVDVGGTHIKVLCGGETEPRRIPSGKDMTPSAMVDAVRAIARDWKYEVVSIGYPGAVGPQGPRSEPGNLGRGWVGFDFAARAGCEREL